MAKAETLLKVVLTPLDPPEGMIKNYLILSTDSHDEAGNTSMTSQRLQELKDGFTKILDLKVHFPIQSCWLMQRE
jgi:hypothetical protein